MRTPARFNIAVLNPTHMVRILSMYHFHELRDNEHFVKISTRDHNKTLGFINQVSDSVQARCTRYNIM